MVKLRGYQDSLECLIFRKWREGARNVKAVLPTGGGKTEVFCSVLNKFQGHRVVIAHRKELIAQCSMKLARDGVPHTIELPADAQRKIANKHVRKFKRNFIVPTAKVHVCSVDTLMARDVPVWMPAVELWVTDESHHLLQENKWGQVIARMPETAKGLGVTATPCRADGKGLGRQADGVFDCIVLGPNLRWLIDQGYLVDYYFACPQSDVVVSDDMISSTTGDYNQVKLREAIHKSATITGDVVANYLRHAPGKQAIVFAVDIEHSGEIAAAFEQQGVKAIALSSKTSSEIREHALNEFEAKSIQVLVNVDLFGEGFDVPSLDVVIMARHTASLGLYMQMVGRVLRLDIGDEHQANWDSYTTEQRLAIIAASPKPHGLIIDHVGNLTRHFPPDVNRYWTLDRRDRKKRATTDAIPITICGNVPACGQPYERSHPACPYCGWEPPMATGGRGSLELVDGDLILLDPAMLKALRDEIDRIDGPCYVPQDVGMPTARVIQKRHHERQVDQAGLRGSIAVLAGFLRDQAYEDRRIHRHFYLKYGVDILTAQTLGSADAAMLKARIDADLIVNNVMPPI